MSGGSSGPVWSLSEKASDLRAAGLSHEAQPCLTVGQHQCTLRPRGRCWSHSSSDDMLAKDAHVQSSFDHSECAVETVQASFDQLSSAEPNSSAGWAGALFM